MQPKPDFLGYEAAASSAVLFPATSSCCKAVRRGLVNGPLMAIERLSPGGEQVVDGVRDSPQRLQSAAINDGERRVLLLPPVAHQTFCDDVSPNTPLVGSLTPLLYRISSWNGYSTTCVPRRDDQAASAVGGKRRRWASGAGKESSSEGTGAQIEDGGHI